MQILPVEDAAGSKLFLKVPLHIYKNDANWIRPLDKDINDVFDKNKNKAFRFGKATRWILKDDDGNLAGRIAAFTNKKYKNKGDDMPVGGIGFFECINDRAAAESITGQCQTLADKRRDGGDGRPDQFWRKGPLVGT